MEILVNSFFMVALTEMGDKTQLLALLLASRYKRPFVVMAGILVATIFNHLLASTVGVHLAQQISPEKLSWILAALFFGFAAWVLIPDKDDDNLKEWPLGPFLMTTVTFFLAEMGDKTQLSTVTLAARFQDIWLVTCGTTLGMMFSDGLAVAFGNSLTQRVPMKWIRVAAALLFVAFGIHMLIKS